MKVAGEHNINYCNIQFENNPQKIAQLSVAANWMRRDREVIWSSIHFLLVTLQWQNCNTAQSGERSSKKKKRKI